jgi:hypothetical protein
MKQPKWTPGDILKAFKTDKPRKSNFGNFRIEGDALVYRAQSSVEAPPSYDKKEWPETRQKIGDMIRKYDGRLVDENGKALMLEALTSESKTGKMKIQYFETNIIAQKIYGENGLPILIGNTSTLELVGRTVSYGNVSENRSETDIQKAMKLDPDFIMLPLDDLQERGVDSSELEIIQRGASETFRVEEKSNNYPYPMHVVSRIFTGATLFRTGERYFLRDIDRLQIKAGHMRTFLSELPGPVQDIVRAYDSLVPQSVREAETEGLKVERLGKWFFIPVPAPKMPDITLEERMLLLGSESYLSEDVREYLIGQKPMDRHSIEVDNVLKKVPKNRDLDHKTEMQLSITLNQVTYCKGLVKDTKWEASLDLGQWFKPVQNLSVSKKVV